MRRTWWVLPIAAFVAADTLVVVQAAQLGGPWQTVAALGFVFVAPGASLVPLLRLPDVEMEFVLVVPVSFAMVALVAAALFYPGWWSADRELVVLLGVCAAGLALQHWRLPVPRRRTE